MTLPITRAAVCGLALLAAGCGGPKFNPVRGQLVFTDGTPVRGLDGGQIVCETTGADGKPYSASGSIDAEGKFVLGSEQPGDGAVAGKHKVSIAPRESTGDVPLAKVVHPKYEKFETSGLEIDVKPGPNEVTVKVEPAPAGG